MTSVSGLVLRDLGARVGAFHVSAVSLTVAPGEILAVVGPSGCGKTTLLHSIAGMRRSSGVVLIDDDDVSHVPPEQRTTALVLQSPVLFPGMTVRENVGYGLDDARMPNEKREDLIDIAMASMNISGLAHRAPSSLSGGQAQRVALARTLVRRPRVLLLDEPLSHVEPPMRRAIRKDIVEQVRRRKLAAVYVTHDVEEAFLVGDRVAVMREGKIEQQGEPIHVYRRPCSRYVADLLGRVNIVAGSVLACSSNGTVTVKMGAHCRRRPRTTRRDARTRCRCPATRVHCAGGGSLRLRDSRRYRPSYRVVVCRFMGRRRSRKRAGNACCSRVGSRSPPAGGRIRAFLPQTGTGLDTSRNSR